MLAGAGTSYGNLGAYEKWDAPTGTVMTPTGVASYGGGSITNAPQIGSAGGGLSFGAAAMLWSSPGNMGVSGPSAFVLPPTRVYDGLYSNWGSGDTDGFDVTYSYSSGTTVGVPQSVRFVTSLSSVPEPSSFLLFSIASVVCLRRRRAPEPRILVA
jgi:hypothetical protein